MRDSDINRELEIARSKVLTVHERKESLLKNIADVRTERVSGLGYKLDELDDRKAVLIKKITKLEEYKKFNEHLRHASKVVAGWPELKQGLLGRPPALQAIERVGEVSKIVNVWDEGLVEKINKGLAKDEPKLTVFTVDISDEPERKYEWICPVSDEECEVTIVEPQSVSFHKGCTTHKVTNKNGTIIYVPAPGVFGCIVVVEEE